MRVMKLAMTTSRNWEKSRKNQQLWTVILHGLLINVAQISLMVSLAPFFTDLDPSFFILRIFFPRDVKSSWALRVVRSVLNGLLTTHWVCCGVNVWLFGLVILNMMTESLHMVVTLLAKSDHYCCLGRRKLRVMLIRKLIFTYRHLVILVEATNSIVRWTLALTLGCGMGIFVFGGTGSVLLAGKVKVSTYFVFPLMALTMASCNFIMVPRAGTVDTFSTDFILGFKMNRLERYPFRTARSMKPMRIQVGSFYYFRKESALKIFVRWVENCINVLLSFG
jgi:hypothetical protein